MAYSIVKKQFANPGERCFYERAYFIYNQFGRIAIVYANTSADALDEAVDAGKLDSERMSEDDYLEYSANGWEDSFIHAGNASEPFWSEYLSIQESTS